MPGPSEPAAEEIIRYHKDARTRIATITFDRPDYLNAPTIAARLRYADLLHRAGIDDDVKVLVVRGRLSKKARKKAPAGKGGKAKRTKQ